MNLVVPNPPQTSRQFHPMQVLQQLADSETSGCLHISNRSVEWLIYFDRGKIIYGTHSLEPHEKFERHLRYLSHRHPSLTSAVRTQARSQIKLDTSNPSIENSEYAAIQWLMQHQAITASEAIILTARLTREALESFLLLKEITHQLHYSSVSSGQFYDIESEKLLTNCQQRLVNWQTLSPQITSPNQRPYLVEKPHSSRLSSVEYQKLKKVLIGFSFRQLAVLLNQDELALVKSLHPLIVDSIILVREPQSPFDLLPKIFNNANASEVFEISTVSSTNFVRRKSDKIDTLTAPLTNSTIVCVDDSDSILKIIKQLLSSHNFDVITLNDSLKALREVIRIRPDLILLDVGMPNLDGYNLCRLIRNHSAFRETPIVMVTGNTGFIDRTKAKVAGATDYLTKPFDRTVLETMVLKYLNPV